MKKLIQKWTAPIMCGLFLFLCLRFIFFIGYVPTASMEPAISAGSYVFGLRVFDELQRGDVVVFRLESQTLTKRIAAVPGDVISVDDFTELEVPTGYFYMLGDNPTESFDSRHWEHPFIHESAILARLFPILN